MEKAKTNDGKGSKESGSNCERNRTTTGGGQTKKRQATQRQTKRNQQKTPEKEQQNKKVSVRKRGTKTTSSTVSTDTNKSSENKNSKGSSPDKDSGDDPSSSSNHQTQKQSVEVSKEEPTTVMKTCMTEVPSKSAAPQKAIAPTIDDEKSTRRQSPKSPKKKAEKEKESDPLSEKSKKFNMHLAQLFFKRMAEAQRTKQKSTTKVDVNLEVMPDVSYKPSRKRKSKSKGARTHKSSRPSRHNALFKDGVPYWVVPIRQECVQRADGVMTRTPEVDEALEEEGLSVDAATLWSSKTEEFTNGHFNDGKIEEDRTRDDFTPFLPVEELEMRNDVFFRMESVTYYTLASMLALKEREYALTLHDSDYKKLEKKSSSVGRNRAPLRLDTPDLIAKSKESHEQQQKEEQEMKTCPTTQIRFIFDQLYVISYDRRCPIKSIMKFKRKYNDIKDRQLKKSSREGGSREQVSKDAKSKEAKSKDRKRKAPKTTKRKSREKS